MPSPSYFKSYAEHRRLRLSWFCGLRCRGLTLFLPRSPAHAVQPASGQTCVVVLFLSGVIVQIVAAFPAMHANGCCYFGEDSPVFRRAPRYRFWPRIASRFRIGSVVLFDNLAR